MKIVRTIAELRAALRGVRRRARADDGRAARRATSRSSAPRARRTTSSSSSLFVNPAQFDEPAGPRRVPARRGARRCELAEAAGVDLLFAPPPDEMYPPGFATWVDVEEASRGLEGDARPGHFRGVATVCLKLFNVVQPRARVLRPEGRAAGGRRAAARARSESRLRDPRRADGARADGLALSSRNVLLSPDERDARARAAAGARGRRGRVRCRRRSGRRGARGAERPHPRLRRAARPRRRAVLATAVRVGSIRLIDNVLLEGELA